MTYLQEWSDQSELPNIRGIENIDKKEKTKKTAKKHDIKYFHWKYEIVPPGPGYV